MWLLERLGHRRDGAHHAVLDAPAVLRRRLECPRCLPRWDPPVTAVVGDEILGPRLLDDPETLFEGFAVGGVDLVVLMGERPADPMRLLRHHVDPSALIPAREAGVGPAAGHVVEHGDVLGHTDRVRRRQDDPQLSHADARGLEAHEEVEEHGVVRQLESLDVKVVLGETDRVVAPLVGELGLFCQLRQHWLVQVASQPGPAALDVAPAPDGRQVEERDLHRRSPALGLRG